MIWNEGMKAAHAVDLWFSVVLRNGASKPLKAPVPAYQACPVSRLRTHFAQACTAAGERAKYKDTIGEEHLRKAVLAGCFSSGSSFAKFRGGHVAPWLPLVCECQKTSPLKWHGIGLVRALYRYPSGPLSNVSSVA